MKYSEVDETLGKGEMHSMGVDTVKMRKIGERLIQDAENYEGKEKRQKADEEFEKNKKRLDTEAKNMLIACYNLNFLEEDDIGVPVLRIIIFTYIIPFLWIFAFLKGANWGLKIPIYIAIYAFVCSTIYYTFSFKELYIGIKARFALWHCARMVILRTILFAIPIIPAMFVGCITFIKYLGNVIIKIIKDDIV